jgi:hypothetical protein
MADLMIDLETLGTKPDAIILTIGAQLFDPTSSELWVKTPVYDPITGNTVSPELNIRLDVDQQEALGRTTNEDTIKWWSSQTPEAQEEAFGEENRVDFKEALQQLVRMAEVCGPKRTVRVWSKGPTFDIMMLEHAMEQTGIRVPWSFWNVRDARTVYGLCPLLDTKKNGPISHCALDDCRRQIELLRESFTILGVSHLK